MAFSTASWRQPFYSNIRTQHIRILLGLFERRAYVGYTATPFANIFIPLLELDEAHKIESHIGDLKYYVGQDLFPKDFIINIKPPSNYVGPSKVFGIDAEAIEYPDDEPDFSGEIIRVVNDYYTFVPDRHKKDDSLPEDIPPSLQRAIKSFILSCAVRRARGQINAHNSMLVHVTLYIRWQDKIASLVDRYLKSYQHRLEFGLGDLEEELRQLWEEEYVPVTGAVIEQQDYQDPQIRVHDWSEIQPHLYPAAAKIEVRAVHGERTTAYLHHHNITPLDYYDHQEKGLSLIAVGGNKLSRGLTLEGLSISYYLRASKMYDTLMQMGRWFGYRPGYLDLCRLFTSSELVEWYRHIAVASEEVRMEFDNMQLLKKTPRDYGLKVRTHPGVLQITSANKFRFHEKMELSYSNTLVETYTFNTSRQRLEHNLKVVQDLVSALGAARPVQNQEYGWTEVDPSNVITFIDGYLTDQRNIAPDKISDYVQKQARRGDLSNWTVVMICNPRASGANMHSLETGNAVYSVGLTHRTDAKTGKHYTIKKSHIISPEHEYLDFDRSGERYQRALLLTQRKKLEDAQRKGQEDSFKPPSRPSGYFVRQERGSQNGLLLIYLLDPSGYREGPQDIPIIGYAISFPQIENDDKVEYAVNQQFLKDELDYADELDEDLENDDED